MKMGAVRLTLGASDLPDSLAKVRRAIERAVPVGFEQHKAQRGPCFEVFVLHTNVLALRTRDKLSPGQGLFKMSTRRYTAGLNPEIPTPDGRGVPEDFPSGGRANRVLQYYGPSVVRRGQRASGMP